MPPANDPTPANRLLEWIDRHRGWCFVCIGLLYGAGFNGQWRMGSDSALYMSVGRNLAEGLGYTHGGSINRLVFPGLPWLLAALSNLGRDESYVGPTLVMLVLALACLALTYRLVSLHSDRRTAVWVTCLTAITYTFYRHGFEILSDMLFCTAVMSVLAGYEGLSRQATGRSRWFGGMTDWLLLTVGLLAAAATRPTMWVLVAALLITCVVCWMVGTRRRVHGIIVLSMVVCTAGVAWSTHGGLRTNTGVAGLPNYEHWVWMQLQQIGPLCHRIFTKHIPKFLEPHFTEAVFGMELGPGLNTIAAVIILALGVNLARHRLLWGMWFMGLVAAMLIAEPAVRYTLPLVPLVAFAWWRAILQLEQRLPERLASRVAVVLLLLWCVPNLVRVGNFILHQRRTPFIETYKHGRYAPLIDLGAQIEKTMRHDDVIIAYYAYELGYISRRTAIYPPNVQATGDRLSPVLADLLASNRAVYLVANSDEKARVTAQTLGLRLGEKQLTALGPPVSAYLYRLDK